ncbi:unnamed protein product [Leptosia nina]|uniref:Spire n=1 Tax=Leptosia nina TaxID=320188 RepID=A0AAV1J4H1_9NEOP
MSSEGSVAGAVCVLDGESRLNLQQILQAFNSNVSEEHAWALCYQAARCFQRCLNDAAAPACYLPTQPAHLLLHKDGTVHPDTLLHPGDDTRRQRVKSEYELVVNLGLVVYRALDYTHGEDEERLISPDLEALITDMTISNGTITDDDEECGLSESLGGDGGAEGVGVGVGGGAAAGGGDTDDEGIERDSEPPRLHITPTHRLFLLDDVIQRCVWHCGVWRGRSGRPGCGGSGAREAAAAHYRAVCRALVAEALELASFLARVRVTAARDLGAAEDSAAHLDTLQFSDWARFWMQVIGELRMGVKLKKVSHSRTPIEYELTPYEILMDDIRSRRYKLRKVDSAIPHNVKKDAHAMILEFIRSRPPLKKASERKLAPARRETTPREQLLRSIQQGRPLRPTPYSRRFATNGAGGVSGGVGGVATGVGVGTTGSGDVTPRAPPQRRLIKVDFDNLEDDEDDEDTETCGSPNDRPLPAPRIHYHHQQQQTAPKPWKRTAYDLATQCPSRRASMRRHTVAHALSPGAEGAGGTGRAPSGAQSLPHSRPESRGSCAGAGSLGGASDEADLSWSRSSLQDDLIKSQWQEAILSEERLSLTLEEIVHIRSVLTKAELEVLPVEGRVKEDVEKQRVCFLCLKTRFGMFGPWGQKCKLCKKTVCRKCCSKMRIPTEHFAHVPVVLLSPSLLPSPDEERAPAPPPSFPRSLVTRLGSDTNTVGAENSVGSAPSSPAAVRRSTGGHSSAPSSRGTSALGFCEPLSLPPTAGFTSGNAAERLRGVQMAVCLDCKAMVLQIIKSSRACRSASRDRALRHLTLDLAPVYAPHPPC